MTSHTALALALALTLALVCAAPLAAADAPAPPPAGTVAAPASEFEALKAKVAAAETAANAAYKAIDADPVVAELRRKADAATQAWQAAYKADPAYAAAKSAEDEAKKVRELLLDAKLATDPQVGPLLAERDAGRKAEEDGRAAEVAADAAKDKAAKDAAGQLRRDGETRRKAAERKLKHPRRAAIAQLESTQDAEVLAQKSKVDEAAAARKAIENGEAYKALRDAAEAAKQECKALVDQKRAASPEVQTAKQALDQARAELKAATPK